MLNSPANGVHAWRQTDGLSIALKYYEEGNGLFEPKMHNVLSNEGKAAGEFPLLYYIVGKLYHVFGVHFWVYRGLWWLISFLGHFFLFKLFTQLLKDPIWGILISLFTFTSPLLFFYGFSFIPDPVALSCTFMAWYTIYKYALNKSILYLIISAILVALAALLKLTSLISIIAIMIFWIVRKIQLKEAKGLVATSVAILFVTLIVLSWYSYAAYYNKLNSTIYFYLKMAPIWDLNLSEIENVFFEMKSWLRAYFYKTGRHVLYVFAFLILLPIYHRKSFTKTYWFYILCFGGALMFFALFFPQFSAHDYYMVNLLFLIPLTVYGFLKKYNFLLKKKPVYAVGFKLLFLVLLIASVVNGKMRAKERFSKTNAWLNLDLYELRAKLPEIGVHSNDLVLFPHDPSSNLCLYAINRNGWTKLNHIQIPSVFSSKLEKGAEWMIIPDSTYYNLPEAKDYNNNLIYEYKGIRVYSLK